eukprot:m.425744 g.425744  ORF g.425744 m.425744 type:complete len:717 (+) comp20220_c0_seq3:144-2294(+)
MADLSAFLTALVINAIVAFVVILLFSYLRTRRPRVYEPRSQPELAPKVPNPPAPIGPGMFAWVSAVFRLTDDEIYAQSGLDALMYCKFFTYGLKVSAMCSIYGLLVLIPVYATAGNEVTIDGVTTEVSGIDVISLSNVAEESSRLWATFFSVFLFAGIAMYNLVDVYKSYSHFRLLYFREHHSHFHAVLLRDLPKEITTGKALKEKISTLFDDVVSATVAKDVKALEKLILERDQVCLKLEHAEAVAIQNPDKDPPTAKDGGFLCIGGKKVNAQEFFGARLDELNEEIAKAQEEAKSSEGGSSGFVVFQSRKSAVTLSQVNSFGVPGNWTAEQAPESRDVKWANLFMGYYARLLRGILVSCATWALVVLWVIPVAFVSALTTLESLGDLGADWLVDLVETSDVLKGFLEGFLPTLALIIFMALLPPILTALTSAEGVASFGLISKGMMTKLYLFYLINVFVVSLLAGSVFDQLDPIIEDPSSIISLLGNSVPTTGIFFTTYVMILALSQFPMALLRVGPLIVSWIKLKWLAKTRREQEAAWYPGPYDVGRYLPVQLLVALLALVYASSAPIILPFAILFFGFGYIVSRYLVYYVHVPNWETGGAMWPAVFNRCMLGVLVYEIAITAMMGIKKGKIQTPLMVLIFPPTILFWQQMNKAFQPAVVFQPYVDACETEAGDELDATEYMTPAIVADADKKPMPYDPPGDEPEKNFGFDDS